MMDMIEYKLPLDIGRKYPILEKNELDLIWDLFNPDDWKHIGDDYHPDQIKHSLTYTKNEITPLLIELKNLDIDFIVFDEYLALIHIGYYDRYDDRKYMIMISECGVEFYDNWDEPFCKFTDIRREVDNDRATKIYNYSKDH